MRRKKPEPYIPKAPETLEDGLKGYLRAAFPEDTSPKNLEHAFEEVWKREDGIEDEDEDEEMRIFLSPSREG